MLNPEIAEAMDASERYLMDEDAYREYLQKKATKKKSRIRFCVYGEKRSRWQI